LYMRNHFRHSILWQGIGLNRGRWQWRNLHRRSLTPVGIRVRTITPLLPERNEETFKHLVANTPLDKGCKNNLLGQSLVCGNLS
jgi:hypothetical protein